MGDTRSALSSLEYCVGALPQLFYQQHVQSKCKHQANLRAPNETSYDTESKNIS
jgi:hypothetical protein